MPHNCYSKNGLCIWFMSLSPQPYKKLYIFKHKIVKICLNFILVHPAHNWNYASLFTLGTADSKIHYGNVNL